MAFAEFSDDLVGRSARHREQRRVSLPGSITNTAFDLADLQECELELRAFQRTIDLQHETSIAALELDASPN